MMSSFQTRKNKWFKVKDHKVRTILKIYDMTTYEQTYRLRNLYVKL